MSVNGVEVIPSAQRLVKSLRDVGYEFATAVADLIDNSVEAKANTVWVDVVWDGESSYVTIADNGEGMSPQHLREAMRFGSERDYESEDLGKFGLGLKTASLSQCLKFTVATRQNPNRADMSAYCWDVDHVSATNRWEILPVKAAELHDGVRTHLKETTGTVITWERLDRILGFKKPDGESARKHLYAMCRELENHVAMVFHRFLSGEVRGKRLAIYVNENKVAPWDPFARTEANTKKLEAKSFRMEGHNGKGDIIVEPFVLPHQGRFSSPEAFNRSSGPEKWNKQQGFYIYRADRMIQSGGWSGLRALDEHRKLSRIAISFNPKLDEEFKINVAKMRVSLPQIMREAITKAIAPAVSLAEEEYRQRERKAAALSPMPSMSLATASSAPAPSSMPAASGGSTSTTTALTDGGIPPSSVSTGVNGVGGPQLSSKSGSPVTRVELGRVAGFLRNVARPEEAAALESVVVRALSSLPE